MVCCSVLDTTSASESCHGKRVGCLKTFTTQFYNIKYHFVLHAETKSQLLCPSITRLIEITQIDNSQFAIP